MSSIVASAKRWVELHFELLPIDGSEFKEVQSTDKHLEEIMIRFAQAHVNAALEAASNAHEYYIKESYPLENVK